MNNFKKNVNPFQIFTLPGETYSMRGERNFRISFLTWFEKSFKHFELSNSPTNEWTIRKRVFKTTAAASDFIAEQNVYDKHLFISKIRPLLRETCDVIDIEMEPTLHRGNILVVKMIIRPYLKYNTKSQLRACKNYIKLRNALHNIHKQVLEPGNVSKKQVLMGCILNTIFKSAYQVSHYSIITSILDTYLLPPSDSPFLTRLEIGTMRDIALRLIRHRLQKADSSYEPTAKRVKTS